jgi:hypothetical protein
MVSRLISTAGQAKSWCSPICFAESSGDGAGATKGLTGRCDTVPSARYLPGVLIGAGAVLVVMAFLLAFTVFGEVSAAAGVALVIVGSAMTGRRAPGKATAQPGKH